MWCSVPFHTRGHQHPVHKAFQSPDFRIFCWPGMVCRDQGRSIWWWPPSPEWPSPGWSDIGTEISSAGKVASVACLLDPLGALTVEESRLDWLMSSGHRVIYPETLRKLGVTILITLATWRSSAEASWGSTRPGEVQPQVGVTLGGNVGSWPQINLYNDRIFVAKKVFVV